MASNAISAPTTTPPSSTQGHDIILLSIPDAGGLRISVSSDNKIHTHVAGKEMPPSPVVPVVGFTADSAYYATGGSVTLKAEHKVLNLFGTGLDLRIKAGTKVTASTTGVTLEPLGTTGGVAIVLPVRDDSGAKTEVDIASFHIGHDGAIDITGTVKRATSIHIPGGFALSVPSITVAYKHTPGNDDDDATITLGDPTDTTVPPVIVTAPIPGILTQNPAPLKLSVKSATVNTDGQVSFTSANLSQTAMARSMPVQVAGGRKFAAAASPFPFKIPLMKPADFNLIIWHQSDVSLTMKDNVPTGLTVVCDIELPSSFSTTEGGAARVTAKGIKLDIAQNGFVASNITVPKAYFKGFGVTINNAVLDLSETKSGVTGSLAPASGDVAWEGFYIADATFSLPSDMIWVGDDGNVAKGPDLKMKNCWIDNNGLTGGFSLVGDAKTAVGALQIDDFTVQLSNLTINVERNSIKDAVIDGTFSISSLSDAPITVSASVSDSGLATMQVKTGTLDVKDFHAKLQIDNGTFTHDVAGKNLVALSGTWSFNDDADDSVKGMKVAVKDLEIGSNGSFALDSIWIDMPASASIDFDVVTLEPHKIGFGGIGPGKIPWVGFNGSVGIGGDLPIQVDADFEGLYIFKTGEVHVGRISIDCDIEDIIHVDGYIEQTEGTMTHSIITDKNNLNPVSNINKNKGEGNNDYFADGTSKVDPAKLTFPPNADGTPGKPLKILTGAVAIELPILSSPDGGDGPGGQIEFLIARNCWYAMGSFSAGGTPLVLLGDSGFAIYGFGGGVGYNVKPEYDAPVVGIPNRDYQMIPDIDAIDGRKQTSTGLPNIIALASVRMGVVTPPDTPSPLWGDITLMVDVANLIVTLNGNVYLACAMPDQIPATASAMDRVLSATLSFDGPNKTFIAKGNADFCIPSRQFVMDTSVPPKPKLDAKGLPIDNTLIHLHAPFMFKVGNYNAATDAGWDVYNNRVFYAALGGPVDLGDTTTDQHGISAHRNVTIANPVTFNIRGLPNPIQGAVTLDANKGEFTAAMKIHETFHADSGGDKKYDLTVWDVHVATIKYKYTLDGQFDTTGWVRATFPGIDSSAFKGISGSGEFYLNASVSGTASDLNVDPAWGFSFGVPDIGITAVLEADLAGTVTPGSLELQGQVYADLGFSIAKHSLSLPFSEDIDWKYN